MKQLLTFLTIVLMTTSTQALVLNDVEVPATVTTLNNQTTLYLKGAAIRRAYGIVKSYVGQLYVTDPALNEEALVNSKGDRARRMVFHVTSNRVSYRRFISSINDGLPLNISDEEIAKITPSLEQAQSFLNIDIGDGTIINVEWEPETRLNHFVVNGELKGSVPGIGLNNALLKLWIGKNPVGRSFKKGILGLDD